MKEDRSALFYQGQGLVAVMWRSDIIEGTTVILPVHVEGAMFSIGDIHALQGMGKITGCASECQESCGGTRISRNIIRGSLLYRDWPQVNTDEWMGELYALGYRNLSEAVKLVITELIRRMEKEHGMDHRLDSYQLLNLIK